MAIDILKARKAFKNYVKNYNPEDEKIKLKIAHIERVSQIAKKISESLNLSQEDIELAELIGLLHDIGRFEQVKRYHTFVDKNSIDHGQYGVKVLFENGVIRDFIEDDTYDEIIKKSIFNHNKAKIEDGLTEKEKLHCKIVRDADKTDIFYVATVESKSAVWEKEDLSNDKITDEIYREFMEEKLLNYKEMKTGADSVVSNFALLYDLNFSESLKIIKENNYIDQIYKRHIFNDEKTMKRYTEIYQISKKYLEEKG